MKIGGEIVIRNYVQRELDYNLEEVEKMLKFVSGSEKKMENKHGVDGLHKKN